MRISGILSGPYWIVRAPVVSALWYAVLVHLLLEPFSTLAIIISSAIIAISVLRMNSVYFGLLSPVPMIISLVLLYLNYPQNTFTIFAIVGALWSVLWIIFMIVFVRLVQKRYHLGMHKTIYE